MTHWTDENEEFDALVNAAGDQLIDGIFNAPWGDATDALEDISSEEQGPAFVSCSIPEE